MTEDVEIRESVAGDRAAIEALYPQAFPDEDLVPLVRALLAEGPAVLSLVAATGSGVAGHVLFTRCGLAGGTGAAALLAPLCVAPARQRQGIGSALARAGLRRLEDEGVGRVFVLGDPAYYGRLGFRPEGKVSARAVRTGHYGRRVHLILTERTRSKGAWCGRPDSNRHGPKPEGF